MPINNSAVDYDFIGFTFGDKHSINDLHIYRTSDSSRNNLNIAPTMSDKTAVITGNDSTLWFATEHKQSNFSINFAYDELSESDIRTIRQTFNGKEIKDLIFDETPYKVYSAKVTGTPQLKFICFDKPDGTRVYKGEGSVQFTCYMPYAHTPRKDKNGTAIDGRLLSSYDEALYPTKTGWQNGCGLMTSEKAVIDDANNGKICFNTGDLPSYFKVKIDSIIPLTNTEDLSTVDTKVRIQIGNMTDKMFIEFIVQKEMQDFVWDSKTGVVKAKIEGEWVGIIDEGYTLIAHEGRAFGTIPVTEIGVPFTITLSPTIEASVNNNNDLSYVEPEYDFWYY